MSAIAIASGGSALTPATGNISLFVSNLGSDSSTGLPCFDGTISPGSGYSTGQYGTFAAPISFTGGSGTGAKGIVWVSALNGQVVAVAGINPGTGYHVGDILSATTASLGGSGSGFTYTLTGIRSSAQPFATIQHAISVGLGFDYQSLYTLFISVVAGTYHESIGVLSILNALPGSGFGPNAWLVGDPYIPTNVKISPNNGLGTTNCTVSGTRWMVDGFSFVADASTVAAGNNVVALFATEGPLFHFPGQLDFNTGTGINITNPIVFNNYSRVSNGFGFGSGVSNNWSFTGDGGNSSGGATDTAFIWALIYSWAALDFINFVFNSAQNLHSVAFFAAGSNAEMLLNSATFVTPGNVTGGPPLFANLESQFFVGVDPASGGPSGGAWPGGVFDPSKIDNNSTIDGFFYGTRYAGAPIDETSIYRGSWQIHKDSNQTTAGLGLNLYVDDAGTVVPLIALTPAPGNLTFFVATTGSDSNPGTSGSPFATIQHAISVALSFTYAGTFFPTINVANGTYRTTLSLKQPVFGFDPSSNRSGFLTGNTGTPTNVLIAPNSGADVAIIDLRGNWVVDGFGLVADSTVVGNDQPMININQTLCRLRNLDFNLGTTFGYSSWVTASNHASLTASATWTIHGTANQSGNTLPIVSQSTAFFGNTMSFTSAINMNTVAFFDVESVSEADVRFVAFTTPGNVTGGTPVSMLTGSELNMGGVDPATGPPGGGAWPTGPFDPTQIDGSCAVDGFFYPLMNAGQLVDETSIYRGSWKIFKDTTNARRYLAYDDGGTIYVKQIGRVPNTQTGTPYVLALSDQDGRVEMNNAGANQLTVPANATVAFPIGTEIRIVQVGAGATTIAGAVGVTVDAAGVVGGQWKSVMLYKRGTNEWVQTNV